MARPALNRPALRQISVSTTTDAAEAVAALLENLFGQSASIYTDEDTQATSVTVYPAATEAWNAARRNDLKRALKDLRGHVNVGAGRIAARIVRQEDWAESWKRHFKPIEIGGALLIRPSWSHKRARAGQVEVVLDPGLSFGTGHHATTSFCLEQIVRLRRAGERQSVLDIGCGSGILAIAAAKLGYRLVHAFDFDPEAVRVCRANAKDNGVEQIVRPVRRDLTAIPLQAGREYDVVCANLTHDLLIAERGRIANRVRRDGVLVLAGILKSQFPQVRRAYESAGWRMMAHQAEEEWKSASFRH